MKVNELAGFLEEELSYPIDRDQVILDIGDVELEAPDEGQTGTIGHSLERLNEESYTSPDELLHAIVGTLGDEYIGRKYYDDRGTNPEATEEPQFPPNDSF